MYVFVSSPYLLLRLPKYQKFRQVFAELGFVAVALWFSLYVYGSDIPKVRLVLLLGAMIVILVWPLFTQRETKGYLAKFAKQEELEAHFTHDNAFQWETIGPLKRDTRALVINPPNVVGQQ